MAYIFLEATLDLQHADTGMHRCLGSKTWRCCSSWNVQNAFWYSQREPINSSPLWPPCMFKLIILSIFLSNITTLIHENVNPLAQIFIITRC